MSRAKDTKIQELSSIVKERSLAATSSSQFFTGLHRRDKKRKTHQRTEAVWGFDDNSIQLCYEMLDDFYLSALSTLLGPGKNNLRRLEAQRNELNSKVRQLRPHLSGTV